MIKIEKKYPIYSYSWYWVEDTNKERDDSYIYKGLPDGRIRNSMSSRRMFRFKPNLAQAMKNASEHWHDYCEDKKNDECHPVINPRDLEIEIEFTWYETWCLEWFGHRTFDRGQSDREVLDSFQEYVERIQNINRKEGNYDDGYWSEPHCLMGAEDRWRWCGAAEDGSSDRGPCPCRCEGCKKFGVIRIGH